MEKELKVFSEYLKSQKLKDTNQRRAVLKVFLKTERHVSCDELYRILRKNNPEIGYATVYRTLKIIQASGMAREVDFGDRTRRLEHEFGHRHHDHLVCLKCGGFFEVFDPEIESLQVRLTRKHSFLPTWHKMDIFGYCRKCRAPQAKAYGTKFFPPAGNNPKPKSHSSAGLKSAAF